MWIKHLNVRAITKTKKKKLLEKNIKVNFCDLRLGSIFLDIIPKDQATS